MIPSVHYKSPLPAHPTPSSPLFLHPPHTMSQEGASLPQEVEGSHDQATAPIPADVGSLLATVMPADSNPSSVGKPTSAIDNAGSFEHASLAVLSAGEDNNAASSKIASSAVLQAGEDNNTASSKVASPAVLHAGEDNNAAPKIASPVVLPTGEEKGNDAAGSKLASPATMLHDCDDNKVESHAGVDNNADRSKLASPAVLHAGDGNNGGSKLASPAVLHASEGNNGGSKIASSVVPQAIVDNTTGSKLNSPAALHAGEHNNAGFKVPNSVVLHASKNMDNNTGRPKFTSLGLLHVAQANKAKIIQAVSHAGGNAGSSRLTRSAAAALHATKDNAAKLAIQVVPSPHHAGKENDGESNTKDGKNKVAGEQHAHEAADVGSGSRKGNATTAEYVDHDLHIFTERERRKKMKNMFSTLHGLLPHLPDKADKATIVGEAVIYIRALEKDIQKLEKLKMERNHVLAPQQQLAVGGSSCRAAIARHPAQAMPAPPPPPAASSSREANLANMVHSLHAEHAKALMTAAAAAVAGAPGSLPHLPPGAAPFPVPALGFQTWTGQNVVVSVAKNEAYINLQCPPEPGTLTKALFVLERNHIEVVTTTISTQDGFHIYGIHARANPASGSARFPENLCAEDRFKLAVSEMVQLINL